MATCPVCDEPYDPEDPQPFDCSVVDGKADCWSDVRYLVEQHNQENHYYAQRHDCPLCPELHCAHCGSVIGRDSWPMTFETPQGLVSYCGASCLMSAAMSARRAVSSGV